MAISLKEREAIKKKQEDRARKAMGLQEAEEILVEKASESITITESSKIEKGSSDFFTAFTKSLESRITETKSVRKCFALYPTVSDACNQLAKKRGISMNDLVNQIFVEYIRNHQDEI